MTKEQWPLATSRDIVRLPPELPHAGSARAVKITLALLLIFGYFLLLSFDGLRAYFSSDDGMNLVMMHGCFTKPLWRIAIDALSVCTPAYRPVGGLFYRILYAFFHFDPLPFRVACYCILTLNLVLAGLLLRCLSGSWEIAAIGTLLFSYHGMLIQLFYNTGTVYDLLCATFYLLALLHYIYKRSEHSALAFWPTIGLVILYSCALDSKEMAASLPFALIAYELLYYGVPKDWNRVIWLRFRAIAVVIAWTVAFTLVKVLLPSPMTGNELYRPSFSPHLWLHNLSWYYNMVVYQRHLFSPHTILLVLALMFAASWPMRSRTMLFGLSFALLTLLPVLIIPPRDSFVLYLPLLGWAAWAAVPLVSARITLTKSLFRGVAPSRTRTAMQAALFIILIVLLYPIHQRKRNDLRFAVRVEQSGMRELLEQMKRQFPTLPHNARILFVDDPFRPGDWGLSFLLRLDYNDPTLSVARAKDMPDFSERSKQGFQYLLAYRSGSLLPLAR